ncbi:MAG: glycosyltransferase [Saprospiraceae bacterium]|nr:glycosyltransferase [Saprospiraceae bacterium]
MSRLPDRKGLKVLHVAPAYLPAYAHGGPVKSIAALCEGLWEQGTDVLVLTTSANGTAEMEVPLNRVEIVHGVPVIYHRRIDRGRGYLSPRLIATIWRRCREFQVVHLHSWWNAGTVIGALICRLRGVPTIISARGSLSAYTFSHGHWLVKRMLHRLGGRQLLKRSVLHATSSKEVEDYAKYVGSPRTVMIPNLLDIREPVAGKRPDDRLDLVFLGRLHPIKNLEFLLEVLTSPDLPPFTLTIIGDGPREYVDQLKAQAQPIAQHVRWTGWKGDQEKDQILASASALVLLSETENFGNVVIEALCQGTPVLVSKGVGLADFVAKYRLGWVVQAEKRACVQALRDMFAQSELRQEIQQRGFALVQQQFGAQTLINQYLQMYVSASAGVPETVTYPLGHGR